ncbi:phage head-tail connector protein [Chitinophaga sp.]|uniref:phage head-tail connector protein n=1 Tax=Chitinophaga sp. TaxID=1869181 RepID=UPI0031D074B1
MLRNRTKDVKVVTDVTDEPVTLQEAKDFLKISYSDEDALIEGLIMASRQLLEKLLNISIATKTLKATFTHDGCYPYQIPYGPVGNITEAKFQYDAEDGSITTTDYTLIGEDFKEFKGRAGYWVVTYDAGYTETPEALKQGILKQVAWMYENRGDEGKTGEVNKDVLYMLAGFNKNAWI